MKKPRYYIDQDYETLKFYDFAVYREGRVFDSRVRGVSTIEEGETLIKELTKLPIRFDENGNRLD